jgi:hypothetical protein
VDENLHEKRKFSRKSFVGSEKSSTFAPAFAQKTSAEAKRREFFDRFT